MKCSQVEKRLSAFQDGELSPQEEERVSEHLESCSACRDRYAEMEKVWQVLGDFERFFRNRGSMVSWPRKSTNPMEYASRMGSVGFSHAFRLPGPPRLY